MDKGCKIEGCDGKHMAKGYCNPHYCKFKKYGDALYIAPKSPETCTYKDCTKKYYAHGFCMMHYKRVRKHGNPDYEIIKKEKIKKVNAKKCIIENCHKEAQTLKCCTMHYKRIKKQGDPNYVVLYEKKKCKVTDCELKAKIKGFCDSHYAKNQRHGNPLYAAKCQNVFQAFLKHVYPMGNACWLWGGHTFSNKGYGRIKFKRKNYSAHRISYMHFKGPIAVGLNVCHACDNPACINPEHLFLGTTMDNVQDKCKKKRHCYGTRNGMAKLNDWQIVEIIKKIKNKIKISIIAKEYGVNISTIYKIKYKESWRHIKI